jgi:putative peptide zinc metalloprotease protein
VSALAATAAPPIDAATRLGFGALSIVADGDEYLAGDSETGVFIAVPEIGAVALRALLEGRTVGEASTVASEHAGQDVNVAEFAEVLIEAGLVATIDGRSLRDAADPGPRWIAGVRPELVRPFFSAPAWTLYASLFAGSLAVLVARPEFRPTFEDGFFYANPALCVTVGYAARVLLAATHELCHWLAARAAGVSARFRVDRRLFVPVFETDLSQLLALPRRQRFGPFLAGMAFDSVILSTGLGIRVAWAAGAGIPPLLVRFAGFLVLVESIALAFQFLVFLRTDIYAVLTTALGCRNLWRVNLLTAKNWINLLSEEERAELADAHVRDRAVARWFALVYAAGLGFAGWVFVVLFWPGTAVVAAWMFHVLRSVQFGSKDFWEALAIAAIALIQIVWPLTLIAIERLRARAVTA